MKSKINMRMKTLAKNLQLCLLVVTHEARRVYTKFSITHGYCLTSLLLILITTSALVAGNPIVPGVGLTDPAIRIFNNRVDLYASHDFSSVVGNDYRMDDWWVWSSDNLVDWRLECFIRPEQTFLKKAFSSCWATDAAAGPIEAEEFFAIHQGNKIEIANGFAVDELPAGSRLSFPRTRGIKEGGRVTLRATTLEKEGAIIDIRRDDARGALLSTVELPPMSSLEDYKEVSSPLLGSLPSSPIDLCVVIKSGKRIRLDWIKFE